MKKISTLLQKYQKTKDYENNASLAINEFSAIVEYKLVKSDYVNGVIEFLRTIFSYKKNIYCFRW